jgi:tetratricopeptide (TPR) repeat protein
MEASTVMSVKSLLKHVFVPLLVLMMAHSLMPGQENQEEEIQYTAAEYDAYQNAVNAPAEERGNTIIEFVKGNPESSLIKYAVASYLQLMQEYQNQGETGKVLEAGEKFLEIQPEEPNTLYLAAVAAYQLQQFEKAAQYGEGIYAQKPTGGLAFVLANSFGQLKKEDKYLQYGEIACRELEAKQCYQILSDMMRIFAGRKQWSKAAEYAQKSLNGFDSAEKPPQSSASEWNDYLDRQRAVAYAIMGRHGWESENWSVALSSYQKTLGLGTDPAMKAEAYYYVGMSEWKQKEIDSAMKAFAKGSVQRDAPHAKHCRQYLETLYKSTHNGSLAGVEDFVGRATNQ